MKTVLANVSCINQSWGSATTIWQHWSVLWISKENCYEKCAQEVPAKGCALLFSKFFKLAKSKTQVQNNSPRESAWNLCKFIWENFQLIQSLKNCTPFCVCKGRCYWCPCNNNFAEGDFERGDAIVLLGVPLYQWGALTNGEKRRKLDMVLLTSCWLTLWRDACLLDCCLEAEWGEQGADWEQPQWQRSSVGQSARFLGGAAIPMEGTDQWRNAQRDKIGCHRCGVV